MQRDISNRHYDGKLLSKKKIAEGVFELVFFLSEQFNFVSGQYVWIDLRQLDSEDSRGSRRAFSLIEPGNQTREIKIIFAESESGFKKTLQGLEIGAEVDIYGPFGQSFTLTEIERKKNIFMIAGGVGVAPFLSLLNDFAVSGFLPSVHLIFLTQSLVKTPYFGDLNQLAKQFKNFSFTLSHELFSLDLFKNRSFLEGSLFLVSGPKNMVNLVFDQLNKAGAFWENFRFEQFYPDRGPQEILKLFGQTSQGSEDRPENFPDLLKKINVYKAAIDSSSNHVVITDLNGMILYANQAAEKMTGFSFSEMQSQTPRLWGGLMENSFYEDLWKNKLKEGPYDGEIVNRRKNGEIYHTIAHISPILTDKKDVIGFIGTEEDISRVKILEDSLLDITGKLELERQNVSQLVMAAINQKNELETLIEKMPIGVVIAEAPQGEIEMINKIGIEMLGKDREGNFGWRDYSDNFQVYRQDGSSYPSEELPLSIALMKGESTIKDDVVVNRPDGSKITLRVVGSPIFNAEGKIAKAIAVFEDVTREKEVDKVKSEFVSLASHQLRTPLTAVNWYAEMLLSGDAGQISETQKEYLSEIYQGGKRMVQLVNALLNVSRLELGTFSVEPEEIDVVALAKEVSDELQPQIQKKKIDFLTNFPGNLPKIPADLNLLEIILQNLLSNAVKYTPESGRVSFSIVFDNRGKLMKFVFSDSGFGIPKNQQSKIFSKLFRADNVKTKNLEGTGLGLYVVKAILDQVGGQIEFESQENKGTTFTVSLPLSGMKKKQGQRKLEEIHDL